MYDNDYDIITHYNREEVLQAIAEEKYAEGYAKGLELSRQKNLKIVKELIKEFVSDGRISEEAAQQLLDGINLQTNQ